MYSDNTISALVDRIGWDIAIPPTTISVDAANLKSDSGRRFNSFHQLVTVENVFDSVNNLKIGNADLNAYLLKMKNDSVRDVLSRVFDKNVLAKIQKTDEVLSLNFTKDGYDQLIVDNISTLDDAIGYAMAVRSIQLFITSERSNSAQRKMKQSYDYLKSELEGFRTGNGDAVVIVKGVNGLFSEAVEDVIKVLFPVKKLNPKSITSKPYW